MNSTTNIVNTTATVPDVISTSQCLNLITGRAAESTWNFRYIDRCASANGLTGKADSIRVSMTGVFSFQPFLCRGSQGNGANFVGQRTNQH
ncbi:MAG: hypothetical protein ACK46M_16755, partial [Planctomyces sp.]